MGTQIAVVSPHPDDDVLGVGGTIAKLVSEGHEVCTVHVTDGRGSPRTFTISDSQMAEIRKQEATEASKVLGTQAVLFLGLQSVKTEGLRARAREGLREVFSSYKPQLVYVTHGREKHDTHRICTKITLDLANEMNLDTLLGYEIWTPIENPDRYVDITEFIDRKVDAISMHKSQLMDKNYCEGILGLGRYRAVFREIYKPKDALYVEAFVTMSRSANKDGSLLAP